MAPHARVGHHLRAAIPSLVRYTKLYERAGHLPAYRVRSESFQATGRGSFDVPTGKTIVSSQRADHGTLRGSASFALVHEEVWSKVNWLLDQVNL